MYYERKLMKLWHIQIIQLIDCVIRLSGSVEGMG